MAMKMLEAGGMPLLTDGIRSADDSNPLGYFELEAVKGLDKGGDLSWLHDAQGRAVKIISWLLTWLPDTYEYRVVFMQRDLDEVLASQNAMFALHGERERIDDPDRMRQIYGEHLQGTRHFLEKRDCFATLYVSHRDVIRQPSIEARRIGDFLKRPLDIDRMAAAVDPRLHRHKVS
jgi:hypothetical protein